MTSKYQPLPEARPRMNGFAHYIPIADMVPDPPLYEDDLEELGLRESFEDAHEDDICDDYNYQDGE